MITDLVEFCYKHDIVNRQIGFTNSNGTSNVANLGLFIYDDRVELKFAIHKHSEKFYNNDNDIVLSPLNIYLENVNLHFYYKATSYGQVTNNGFNAVNAVYIDKIRVFSSVLVVDSLTKQNLIIGKNCIVEDLK